jgi:hypothetical protein
MERILADFVVRHAHRHAVRKLGGVFFVGFLGEQVMRLYPAVDRVASPPVDSLGDYLAVLGDEHRSCAYSAHLAHLAGSGKNSVRPLAVGSPPEAPGGLGQLQLGRPADKCPGFLAAKFFSLGQLLLFHALIFSCQYRRRSSGNPCLRM